MCMPDNPSQREGSPAPLLGFNPLLPRPNKNRPTEARALIQLAEIVGVFSAQDQRHRYFYEKLRGAILREARRNVTKDQRAVLTAIGNGYATVGDLQKITGIAHTTLHKHLRELHRQKLIVRVHARRELGQGGDRRSYLYFLPDLFD